MKIQQFDGGLATRLAPQFLEQNQGVEYENIDNTSGVLTPVHSLLPTTIGVEKYNTFFIKDQEWRSASEPTTFLEYQSVLYSSDGVGRPIKRKDGVNNFLGITPPATAPGTVFDGTPPAEVFFVQNDITQGDLPRSEVAYRLYSDPDGANTLYSVPLEFVVSETSLASPGSTDLASAELLEQVEVEDEVTNTPIGYNNRYPNYQSVNTKKDEGFRSILIGGVEGIAAAAGAKLYRYFEGTWRHLHTFRTSVTSYLDDVYDKSSSAILDEALASPFNGTYQYVYTYYNVTDGTESAPSPLTPEALVQGGSVFLSLADSTDPQVTHKRVYRVGGKRTLFAMVAEVAVGTTNYEDRLLDSEMDGRLLESENYYAAPEGLTFLSESYAMLFGSVDFTLYFTPIGVPNAWPPEYSLQFNAPITGIGPVANGVLVMTETQTFIVTGTGPLSLSVQPLRGDQGCISHFSIQEVQKGALVWASRDGLCSSSGSNVVSITKSVLGDIKLYPVNSAVVDEVYYLHLTDGTTLVWDYRFAPIFKTLNLGIGSVTAANSEVYGWVDGMLSELFKGEAKVSLKYKSPRFVEGSLTEAKTYKKVYVSHDGDIIIDIIINDSLVASKALSGKDSTVIQVPSDKQRGYYIQFEFRGTGSVNELEYRVSRRKDG